jgi:hypothetical protein
MTKIETMTDGGLVKSSIIKQDEYIVIPMKPLDGWFNHEYILITYSKVKNELKLVGINDAKGSTFVDLIVYTDGDPTLFMLGVKTILPKGNELSWSSGICSPTPEMKEKMGLQDNGCVWEGILKIPADYPVEDLEPCIKAKDTHGIVKGIQVKIIQRIEK